MVEQLDLFIQSIKEEEPKKNSDSLGLTPRQWALYRLIKERSEFGLRTTQELAAKSIEGYVWNNDEICHDHCPAIWSDINAINNSNLDKLIISDNFVYWIGSKEETEEYLDKLWNALEPRLNRYWKFLKKIKRDGQGQLLSRSGNPITEESSARDFIEAFINEK